MEWWQSLVSTALIGLDRQPPVPPKAEDALTTVISQLDWNQSEHALLSAAGAIALHRQVGQCPATKKLPPVEPCPLEDLPCCSPQTVRHLGVAFEEHSEVMVELLTLIAAAGQRVPEPLLPRLLRFGLQNAKLRPQIAAVLGKRGQWLVNQNPAWRYGRVLQAADFSMDSSEFRAIWEDNDRNERTLFFQQWREIDPHAARAALERIWSSEPAKSREAMIEMLSTQLSMADEPFLEKALSDRARFVRELAIDLLVQLPESRLCQRMAQRVQAFVQLQVSGENLTISITLPETDEPDWHHDGVHPKPPKGQGRRSWWLQQILASTPLSVWQISEPTAIVQAAIGHEWQDLLLQGWGLAAQRQENSAWAYALVSQCEMQEFDETLLTDLLTLLSPNQRETLLRQKLPPIQKTSEALAQWFYQVARSPHLWSLEFSHWMLEQIIQFINNHQRINYNTTYAILRVLKNMASTFHPQLAPDFTQAVTNLTQDKTLPYWQSTLNEMQNRLSFRQEIHRAFE